MILLAACASPAAEAQLVTEAVDLAAPELGVQIAMGPIEVAPNSETYLCKITRLPNREPLDVIALEHAASASMHHFNIWGLVAGPDVDLEGDCDTVWASTSMEIASPLYASQDPTFLGEFPEGVAGQLPADMLVLMEFHVINPDDAPLAAEARFNAYAAPAGTVEVYANGLYGSVGEISLPPHEASTVSGMCHVEHDIEVFVLGSHFHAAGRRFEIRTLDGTLVYENEDWSSPKLQIMSDDPIHVPAGGGFSFSCDYENETDSVIVQGENSTDEMCMMVGIYYPDQGFLRCLDTAPRVE